MSSQHWREVDRQVPEVQQSLPYINCQATGQRQDGISKCRMGAGETALWFPAPKHDASQPSIITVPGDPNLPGHVPCMHVYTQIISEP